MENRVPNRQFSKKTPPFVGHLYGPAIFILVVVILLMGFIGWSTRANLNRDRAAALQQLSREADALFYALESHGLRSVDAQKSRPTLPNSIADVATADHTRPNDLELNSLAKSARQISQIDNVTYVYGIDINGKPLFDSHPSLRSHAVVRQHFQYPERSGHKSYRSVQLKNGESILEITHPFTGLDATIGFDMTSYNTARTADLHHAVVMIGILAILGIGALFFLFVIKKHLTDIKRIQRLKDQVRKSEKQAEIGRLAAAVAHEIRNPLSAIKGFAQFLGHVLKEDPKNGEYTRIMVKELDRINQVITDLLIFARPLDIRKSPADVKALITHTLRLTEGDSRHGNISVTTDIPDGLPAISLDSNQMIQVLLNLLLNALRVLPPGGEVLISASADPIKATLSIRVEDNGPGIPLDRQQEIFNPFYTTHKKGTGLGLAIAKKIVENHGGEISVKSPLISPSNNDAKGCRLTISLPIEDQTDPMKRNPTPSRHLGSP